MDLCIVILLALCVHTPLIYGAVQSDVDYIADNLDIMVNPLDNTHKDAENYVQIEVTFRNAGRVNISTMDWRIYFNIMYGAGIGNLDCGLYLGHVNGLLYHLTPFRKNFSLQAFQKLHCVFRMRLHASSRYDFMPNWYVHINELQPRVLACTTGEDMKFVGGFDTSRKWKTDSRDKYNPYTAKQIYNSYKRVNDDKDEITIVPTPKVMLKRSANSVILDKDWKIQRSIEFDNEAKYLANMLKMEIDLAYDEFKQEQKRIRLQKGSTDRLEEGGPDAYKLNVDTANKTVSIIASHSAGSFYGCQTLLSIIDFERNHIPDVLIEDVPRFQHRGLSVDVARNFRSVKDIKKLVNVLAMYKMNKLHLHLTDDEGWRIQIPSIPELTDVGSRRCHNDNDTTKCLIPSLGSGPFVETMKSSSGFYTVNEYRDILKLATERHVKVIPEIDIPGHSRAAVFSMEYRSRMREQSSDKINKLDLKLDDFDNESEEFQQRWHGNAMNPCLNSTYTFLEIVIQDMKALHAGIQELDVLHIGGDEVVFAKWEQSPSCLALYPNKSTKYLHRLFNQRVTKILAVAGLKAAMWEEGVYGNGSPLSLNQFQTEVLAQPWYNVWEKGNGFRAVHLANAGYKVILSFATHLYFDHAQEPDPEVRGVYWATRYTDTRKTFGLIPVDIGKNIEMTTFGEPLSRLTVCGGECPKLEKTENFIGLEACLWTEEVRTTEQFYDMLFPRLLAVAERAWHKAPWEDIDGHSQRQLALQNDWEAFVVHLGRTELPRLEQQGVNYHVPPPGAIIRNGRLRCNTLYPNHTVEVKFQDKSAWRVVDGDLTVPLGTKTVYLRSRSPVSRQLSRVITVEVEDSSSESCSQHDHSIAGFIGALLLIWSLIKY